MSVANNSYSYSTSVRMPPLNTFILAGGIILFNIVGVFGNVQLIWISLRKKSTQTKPGVLLAINAFFHIICLLSELMDAIMLLSEIRITRSFCYPFVSFYVFAISQQTVITLAISLDLMLALVFPLWHRSVPTKAYALVVTILCSIYPLIMIVWGFISMNNEVILFCIPSLGLTPLPSRLLILINLIISCIVVICYGAIIAIVRYKAMSSLHKEQQTVIRRLQVILALYIVSFFLATQGANLGAALNVPASVASTIQANTVFFIMICYVQTFYVCIWRSPEYRTAFIEQLRIMTCRPGKSTLFMRSQPSKGNAQTSTATPRSRKI